MFKDIFRSKPEQHEIKHIAFTMQPEPDIKVLKEIIKECIYFNIPMISFFIFKNDSFVQEAFESLEHWDVINQNKVRISAIGKWYNLPDNTVNTVKRVILSSSDFDSFFLTFYIKYDGQKEISDACSLLARQIKQEKVDPEAISPELIKENTYGSFFLPPQLIIISGKPTLNGFLLWDSAYAQLYITNHLWSQFNKSDLDKAIKSYKP